jgi:hypothetical protein
MKYEQIKALEAEKFRRLTGIKKGTFHKMVMMRIRMKLNSASHRS